MHLPFNRFSRYGTLLLALALSACQEAQPQPVVRPEPLPQDEQIQVYTNHNPAASYTEPYRNQTRDGDDLEQVIVETISAAQTSVDVAVQELRLPRIAEALIERHRAGVRVRVALENTYSRPFSSFAPEEIARLPSREKSRHDEARLLIDLDGDGQLSQEEIHQRDALVMLDRAGVPRIDDTADGSAGSNLMHHKFVVADNRVVIVTSANFTTSDVHGDFKTAASRGNANNLLKLHSPALAALFTQEFNILWGDGPGGKPDSKFGVKKPFRPARQVTLGTTQVEVQFSPSSRAIPWTSSTNGMIGKALSRATQSIEMALFVFSDQNLVNLLEPVQQKGVEIRALIEPGFAYRPYSEALDMLGVAIADETCRYEPGNRPWQNPITTVGVPRMPPGDLLHNKFGIVDQQTVVTGSHNWTDAANLGNDETVLVIHNNPTVAAHYLREFDRLYTNAILGVPPAIRKKAEAHRQQCPPPQAATTRTPLPITPDHDRSLTPAKSSRKTAPVSSQPAPSRINLNTATQAQLESLPGVGPSLAKRIIAARQQKPFRSLEDLDQVSGVGPKLLDRLKDQVTW
ncbi:helix-hairpin-helix domain-containing protein [Leptothermofonsia sichuanensis E412]|uniref:phospholipase D-like domain-containing protein n=1 Tax=Leptothermofonsia sichuanensis TaxID=2917832 RepID=UPI001CA6B879|nr:phospholipase D-like domain-containing protein [Leptothermofonsia sichuanensis]QZZ23444.1 helix-hairpin-helix domain-containing protein [Leptothermofonsia sichuanensis E412]